MDYSEVIEDIIKENKWVRNNIGMEKIQCTKLVKENEKLMVIIVSDKWAFPVCSLVKKIMVDDGEIILFYDGEYYERVEEGEYDRYKKYLDREEWNIILGDDPAENLFKKNRVSDRQGFYVQLHETVKDFINGKYDKKDTDELNNIYKIG
ncbi:MULTISPECIES: hypothetical protein [Clostridium]|uniref:hypothetical protein n=1 Tax=Clostridium TaxID=1485 RepID=UPI00082635E7|nr:MULTISPECIES: hypothetical protein [Clostridium]PJI07354.1 hypothetical protein CUB90_05545 [Clostridium sp. CT7]